jgi:hypothetical protein
MVCDDIPLMPASGRQLSLSSGEVMPTHGIDRPLHRCFVFGRYSRDTGRLGADTEWR